MANIIIKLNPTTQITYEVSDMTALQIIGLCSVGTQLPGAASVSVPKEPKSNTKERSSKKTVAEEEKAAPSSSKKKTKTFEKVTEAASLKGIYTFDEKSFTARWAVPTDKKVGKDVTTILQLSLKNAGFAYDAKLKAWQWTPTDGKKATKTAFKKAVASLPSEATAEQRQAVRDSWSLDREAQKAFRESFQKSLLKTTKEA